MFRTQAARDAFVALWDAIDKAPVRVPCQDTDPEVWFPEGAGPNYKIARAFCNRCPVRNLCLDYAIENEELIGMFGGLTPKERFKIIHSRTRRPQGRPRNEKKPPAEARGNF